MKLNEMKNSNTERNGLEAPKTAQKVENEGVTEPATKLDLKGIELFELEAPPKEPVSDKLDIEYIKLMASLGASPEKAVRLEKEHRLEQHRVFQTKLFPDELELTQTQRFKLNRQIVILDACRVTKIVKDRRIHYLHCRVVSRDKGLMHTSASIALFKTDALYPLVDSQLNDFEQDITGMDFKEVDYEFDRLEKPLIITGRILRKIDINPYYEDEGHVEKLATVVQLGVPKEELPNDEVLPATGVDINDAIKRYRAFIEAAGIEG
jgi:hypothetical protein